jgi:1-acyl-sn-glycerol-3-phosphate acyltransferase
MQTIFVSIFRYFERRPKVYWACLLFVFGLSIYGAVRIRFDQDIYKMIPHDPAIEAMNNVLNKTKTGQQVIFTLAFKDRSFVQPDSLITLQEALQQMIEKSGKGYIKNIQDRVSDEKEQQFSEIAINYLPLFLTEKDYREIDRLLEPETLKNTLAKERKLLLSPAGVVASNWIARDPAGMMNLVFPKFQALHFDPNYNLYDGFIFDKDLKKLIFFLEPAYPASETGKNGIFFTQLNKVLRTWDLEHPGLETTYFGGPAVAAENAMQMRQDTILTLSMTLVLLLILIFYVFRKKRAPFLLMLPVVFGAVFGLGATAMLQGSMSIIALGAGAIILGIAIDFSVHFMSHARKHPDMEDNVRTLVFPLTLGAFTTIGAFFALRFANAPVLRDLGTFAAFSLLGASLFTLIFLPHLLQNIARKEEEHHQDNFLDKLARFQPERNKYLLILVVLATPVLWYFAGKVQFDGDLMHLNYLSPKLQKAQEALNQDNTFALSSVFLVAAGKTEEAATQQLAQSTAIINQLKAVGKIRQSLNPVILLPALQEQKARIARWEKYWTPEKQEQIISRVQKESYASGFSAGAFQPFSETIRRAYAPFDSSSVQFLKSLLPNGYGYQNGQHWVIAALKVEPGARESVLKAFEHQNDLIATDRQAVSERLLATLKVDFNKIFLISGLLVFLTLLIAYGRIELALISFLPMALTWIWILGFMSLFGLTFNIVNIIIATLIFGLGDDYSIFMMDGLLEKYRTGAHKIASARSAVYLSVLTTIIGLGTLIFAQHPALKSIAFISVLGLVCVVFVSQVIQPFLFNFLIQKRADKGLMPFTLWSLLKSAFSFFYFFAGCFLLTLVGFILMGLKPLGRKKSKYLFHFLLSQYTRSVLYIMTNVKKRIIGLDKEAFKKPAVYIANHSSFLDILIVTMLHPKLILITNKWVWNSPVFGKIVQMAEYYPAADGAAESITPLKKIVSEGYGIVIFPEGTRSAGDTIQRFHKGAFYIAEKLHLDVIPIVLHGVGYTMRKGDWLLKDGCTSVYIRPRIRSSDARFGNGYRERTKSISRYFRSEFQKVKSENEQPSYFREQLIKSYIYKGPVLEWYCKIKTGLEKFYLPFHSALPKEGLIYDLGCGYGFMSYILQWAAPGRRLLSFDYDEEKIVTAQNNYTRRGAASPENPIFNRADITDITFQTCSGIILSDVLHYLQPEQQKGILEKCYAALADDGVLIIRDGVRELAGRHRNTRFSEYLSTRLLQFNKTQNELHFLKKSDLLQWANTHFMDCEILDHSKKTSNLIFIFRKKKPGSV